MKEETRDNLIFAGIISGFIILFCLFFWFVLINPDEQDKKLCYESMNSSEEYKVMDSSKYHYKHIGPVDSDYYNCCWNEMSLSDDGHYTSEKCKGFKKEAEGQ